ncbi:hypothetical protein RMCBS344292_06750 [Rhizopus microsporus]|nr:hypothetical protein RMCBS344292_06750 [Rhizopus microsporus]
MTDPIAPHSPSISAYMSAHEATNLAYVRYFGKVDQATKATFKSISSTQFTVEYITTDGTEGTVSIPFKTPLTKREDIRPVLESMAKEAEDALGLPSSLSGPPPLKAIAKAMMASVYTPSEPLVPLDSFYLPRPAAMISVGLALGTGALLAYSSDAYLKRQFPAQVMEIRNTIGQKQLRSIMNVAIAIHTLETIYTFITCWRRGWYGPINTAKWLMSTFIFGFGSLQQLKQHAKDVYSFKNE